MAELEGLDDLLAQAGRMSEQLSEVELAVERASNAIESVLGRLGVSALVDGQVGGADGTKVAELLDRLHGDARKPIVGSDQAGGVRVEIQGASGEVGVRIDRELLASGDPERIERSVAEALSAALRQSREKMLDLFDEAGGNAGIFGGLSDALRASLGGRNSVRERPLGDLRVKGRGLEHETYRRGVGDKGIGSHADKLSRGGTDGGGWIG